MNDTIKVGDRVQHAFSTEAHGTVLAAGPEWLYVHYDNGHNEAWLTANCRRIEPEKAVLTPKYPVGVRVRVRQDHSHSFTVEHIQILYRDPTDNSQCWYEDSLEPVPGQEITA